MPVSRKRKLSGNPKLRNIVRGNRYSAASLDLVRSMTPTKQLASFAEWNARAYWNSGVLRGLSPKSPSEINDRPALSPLSLERELEWVKGTINFNVAGLKRHIDLREKFDRALSRDNKLEALRVVDEMERNVGWSLDLMAFKIALLSDTEGLEAQKSWISNNTAQSKSLAARFFGYWFGVRAERLSNPAGYLQEIDRKIPAIANDDIGAVYLSYQLKGRVEKEADQVAALSSLNLHSFVDQYECCVHLAKEASVGRWASSSIWYHSFLPLMKELADSRYPKIAVLFGAVEHLEDFDVRQPTYRVDLPTENFASEDIEDLDDLYDAALAFALSNEESPSSDRTIWAILQKMHLAGRDHFSALNELHKIALLYPRTSIGEWCDSVRNLDTARPLTETSKYGLRRFLVGRKIDVEAVNCMHEPIKAAYADIVLRKVCGRREEQYANIAGSSSPIEFSGDELSDPFIADAYLARFVHSRDSQTVGKVAAKIREIHGVTTKRAVQAELISLLKANQIDEAINLVAHLHYSDSALDSWIPWSSIAEQLDDATVSKYSANLHTSLVCWLLSERHDPAFQSSLTYAIEGYLESQGLVRPSELIVDRVKESVPLKSFLRDQCTIEALSLSLTYDGPRAIEKERIEILKLLKAADKGIAVVYDEEIAHILRSQEVSKALASLQKSKISMDVEPLKEWARDHLRNKFDRYRAYVDAGMVPVDSDFIEKLLQVIESDPQNSDPFAIPENEASALFADITSELSREFSLNPKHGINAYLSLRVRHGTIAGQLRRPFQEQNMLTMVDSGSDSYPASKHWFSILTDEIGPVDAARIAECFSEFSRSYDLEIAQFAQEYVQVSRQEKPKGLFDYHMSNALILGAASDTINVSDFEEFLELFLQLYWLHMARVLERVRLHVREKLSCQIITLVDTLEQEASSIVTPLPAVFRDALLRARGALKEALIELEDWFNVPQAVESAPLHIIDLAEVGKEMVRQLHPDFKPELKVIDEPSIKLTGALTWFTDVFFLLIGNIEKHSGLREPRIDIFVSDIGGHTLQLLIESDCQNIDVHRSVVAEANTRLAQGNYDSNVSREGGSGFYKLAKLTSGFSVNDKLQISLDEQRSKFQVTLRISYSPVGPEKEKAGHATFAG